jgi:hypothetical protein
VYEFTSPAVYVSQKPIESDAAFESTVDEIALERVLPLYTLLRARTTPLYVDVPEDLWQTVDEAYSGLLATLFAGSDLDEALRGSVYRGALMTFRIASVLAVWRAHEEELDLRSRPTVIAQRNDVEAALALGLVYSEHAIVQAVQLEKSLGSIPATDHVGGDIRMSSTQREYWSRLPREFRTAEAESLAESMGICRSTVYDWLGKRWKQLLDKPRHGHYRKRTSMDDGTIGLSDFADKRLDALPISAGLRSNGSIPSPLLEPDNVVLTPKGLGTVVEVVSDSRIAVRVTDDYDGVQTFDASRVSLIQDFASTDPGGP